MTFITATFGQTAEQVKEIYGQPIEAYSVSERIWMTPEFTVDGQICTMRLYPKRISDTANYLSDKLNYRELKKTLNQLAPLENRGKPKYFFGQMNAGGGTINTTYNYEKVGFSFIASQNSYFDPIDKDNSDETTTKLTAIKQGTPKNTELTEEMIVPRDVEIVIIRWMGKTCVK